MEKRPPFSEIKSFGEFSKYYWYREELIKICRELGIDSSGMKIELNHRIEEYFKGNRIAKSTLKREKSKENVVPLTKETGLIECGFKFSQKMRDWFSFQTGIRNFKFNADMVATAKKVREDKDTGFTLGDMLDVFYGKKTYAKYDNSALQWNKFVKDFCADPSTGAFPERLKAAAALWKIVRESDRPKVYSHELFEEYRKEMK